MENIEQIKEDAYEHGYSEGYNDGCEKGEEDSKKELETFKKAFNEGRGAGFEHGYSDGYDEGQVNIKGDYIKEIQDYLSRVEEEAFKYLDDYLEEYEVKTANDLYRKIFKQENTAEFQAGYVAAIRDFRFYFELSK